MAVIPDSTTFLQHTLTCQHCTNCFLLMLLWFAEEMVRGLQQVSWLKVDVSFHSALWPFLAHSTIHVSSFEPWHYIQSLFDLLSDLSMWFGVWGVSEELIDHGLQVKQEWLNYEGAGVIAHVAETLKQQESCVSLEASLWCNKLSMVCAHSAHIRDVGADRHEDSWAAPPPHFFPQNTVSLGFSAV
jgi:hypothetical protein